MKRNTVIFEGSRIGPKMLYSGSLGPKNISKFSFQVLEFFKYRGFSLYFTSELAVKICQLGKNVE